MPDNIDRKFSTASTISLTQDALASALMVIHSGSNKLLPASLLLSLITKASLGMDKVDNTADNEKPVSVHQAQAISTSFDVATNQIQQQLIFNQALFQDALSIGQAVDELVTMIGNPEQIMPIALAKIDAVFTPGPAFSFPICFNDMVILDIDFSLGEAATTGDTVLDIFYTYGGSTASILTSPLVILAGDTVCNGPITSLVDGAEFLQPAAGTRLSGVFTSVGTGAKTPVLTLKWSKR